MNFPCDTCRHRDEAPVIIDGEESHPCHSCICGESGCKEEIERLRAEIASLRTRSIENTIEQIKTLRNNGWLVLPGRGEGEGAEKTA